MGISGYYQQDGRLILDKTDSIPEYPVRDPIGTPLGFEDLNTNKDLLETMASSRVCGRTTAYSSA